MNIAEMLADATGRLSAGGVIEPRREATSLLVFTLGRDRAFLIAHPEFEPGEDEEKRFASFVDRRANREPYQYITRREEFYGLEFEVSPDVLIPRPETEILAAEAIRRLVLKDTPRFLEIGVGSGCISVAVLKNVATATAIGVDISEAAIRLAGRNAAVQGVKERFEIGISDIFSAVLETGFDAILSNPPYVLATDLATLQPEVRDHEPHIALTDGGSGLSLIDRIVSGAPEYLRPGGFLAIEFGFGQSSAVIEMFDRTMWSSIELIKDLNGIDRTALAVRS